MAKYAYWKNYETVEARRRLDSVECSNCGWTIEAIDGYGYNYCPHCGAEIYDPHSYGSDNPW